MRTTLTLDDDVAEALDRIVRERGVSFKEAVNSAIRAGLATDKAVSRPYRMPTSNLGPVRPGINLDKALQLAAELEDADQPAVVTSRGIVTEISGCNRTVTW